MPAVLETLSDMTRALVDWVENDGDEFAQAIPDMIAMAELTLARDLNLELFNAQSPGTLTISTPTLDYPTNMVDVRRIEITVGTQIVQLTKRDVGYLRAYWPNPATTGQPRFWAPLGREGEDQLLIAPTPSSAYAYVIHGIGRPDSLNDNPTGTYLSRHHFDALLWGSLMNAAIHEFDSDQRATVENAYVKALPPAAAETYMARRSSYRRIGSGPSKEGPTP